MVSITKQFRKGLEKDDWPEVKYIFKAIFVLILRDYKAHLVLNDEEVFLTQYPEFVECSLEERKLLLDFKNMMVLSLQIIDPRNHKGEMMTLVGHLCGTVVVTGGGQTAATDRRVLCYERETGILPRKLPERRRKIDKVLLPWTVSANQYIPLPGKSNYNGSGSTSNNSNVNSNINSSMSKANVTSSGASNSSAGIATKPSITVNKPELPPAEILSLATKKGRFSLPDTKSLLKCADSFWNYHRSLMEANQDIPYQPVAVGCVADIHKFPSHDIFYTPHISMNPNGTTNATKLRSFFANLPKIEGVFEPVLDPTVTDTSIPIVKPGMRDTQEARRVAKDAGVPQPTVRDYHRVSSRAPSNRTKARNANFGKPIAPPPLPLSVISANTKAHTMPMPANVSQLKSTASGTSAAGGSSLTSPLTTAATGTNTVSSSPNGSSCDVSIRSLSESDDELDPEGAASSTTPCATGPAATETKGDTEEVGERAASTGDALGSPTIGVKRALELGAREDTDAVKVEADVCEDDDNSLAP
jgi:hypothetical protein